MTGTMSVLDEAEPTGRLGRASTRQRIKPRNLVWSGSAIIVTTFVFVVPFLFILSQAVKTSDDARQLDFSWPSQFAIVDNFQQVLEARDYMLVIAFINSTILTVGSVTLMVILGAMVGYVLQRRQSRWNVLVNVCVFAGLIIPPAVVPDRLGAPEAAPLRDDVRDDPHRARVRPGVLRRCCSARSSARSRRSSTRRPSSTARHHCGCSSRSSSRC